MQLSGIAGERDGFIGNQQPQQLGCCFYRGGLREASFISSKYGEDHRVFADPSFSNMVLYRVLSKRKLPYSDLCAMSRINQQLGGVAKQQMVCATPKLAGDQNSLTRLANQHGETLTELDFLDSQDEVQQDTLKIIPTRFPNVQLVKVLQQTADQPTIWIRQRIVQTLLHSQVEINSKLLLVDSVRIYDAGPHGISFVNKWASVLCSFLQHIRKYWKGIYMTFRFFRLQSMYVILNKLKELDKDDKFSVRVTVMITMEDMFKEFNSEDPVDISTFNQIYQFMTSANIVGKVVVNTNLLQSNLDNVMLQKLLCGLRSSACPSDIIHYRFSGYVVTWDRGAVRFPTLERESVRQPYQKHLYSSKLLIQGDVWNNKVNNTQRHNAKQFLTCHQNTRVDGLYLMTSIRHFKWFASGGMINPATVRFLHIELQYGQIKKLTKCNFFNLFSNLLILSVESNDYETNSETLAAFLDQFGASLPKLQAFWFYQRVSSRDEKRVLMDISFIKKMTGIRCIDIYASRWRVDPECVTCYVSQLRYLRALSLEMEMIGWGREEVECTEHSRNKQNHRLQAYIATRVPYLRLINIFG